MKAWSDEMLRYNTWANRTLFEACRALTDEQLDTHAAGTSASVRDLLTHIAAGQQTIARRAAGGQQPSWRPWPGFDALFDLIDASDSELMAIAAGLDEDAAVDVSPGEAYPFPTSFFLVLAMAHRVEHRTEIKIALESIGVRTPVLDSWSCGAAAGQAQA
jgi:uncharacterized damage-inducible protein DinB